jgi:hypothetical protein
LPTAFCANPRGDIRRILKNYFKFEVQVSDSLMRVNEQNLISFASVDLAGDRHKFDHEAKASRANKFAC